MELVSTILPWLAAMLVAVLVAARIASGGRSAEFYRVIQAYMKGDRGVRVRAIYQDKVGRELNQLGDKIENLGTSAQVGSSRLSAMLDAMVEAVFVTGPTGMITLTNRALDELLRSAAKGRTAMEAIRSTELRDAIVDASNGQNSQIRIEYLDAAQNVRVFDAEVASLRNLDSVIVVLHEVTAAIEADRIRRDFVANASHELRTPLTAILGYAETLRSGAHRDPEAAERYLDVILKHAGRLEALVEDLSALSRAESDIQPIETVELDVVPIVDEVLSGLESKTTSKNLTVRFDTGNAAHFVRGNERALDQIILNLVDNAIKYTPEGGTIVIKTGHAAGEADIEVHNTGPGIPPQHLGRIFERFYRVDGSRSRDLGGTGLGLAIVKHLVASMGGKVEVKSSDGNTVFSVTLP